MHTSKKKSLISDVFWKLLIPKNIVRYVSKRSPFRGAFNKQRCKSDHTVLKSERYHFYHIYWSVWQKLSSKKSLLVIGKMLWMSFNTFIAGPKYSLLNRDNLMQRIQMQSSLKWKTFSKNEKQFFSTFLTCTLNFQRFQKTTILIANVFSKLRTRKSVFR